MSTAEEVIRHHYASVDKPLEIARRWLRSGKPGKKREAVKLLEWLQKQFPEAINEVGPELVLGLLECEQPEAARGTLKALPTLQDTPREEMLSRWGRLLRERGDQYVCLQDASQDKSWQLAVSIYREALGKYREAYEVRRGYYPGVNMAALSLLIYAVTPPGERKSEDRTAADSTARELLDRRAAWPREREDGTVWLLATEADCNLILGKWDEAVRLYRCALAEKELQPFHVTCMRRTVQRLLDCHRRIGLVESGPLQDLGSLFPPAP